MNDPIEQLFANYPPYVHVVARRLRSRIISVTQKANEGIYHGAVSYSLISTIFVRLGFN